jgi:hypothetical protein
MEDRVINLIIDHEQQIKIIMPCAAKDIFSLDEVDIVYENQGVRTFLCDHPSLHAFDSLDSSLKYFLNHNLELDCSIKKDIGYLWNQQLAGSKDSDLVYEMAEGRFKYWIGKHFLLWCGRPLATWMYAKNGILFLEITPVYKWHFKDPGPEDQDEFASYEEFKKNYKPFLITQISAETAREWLKQTGRLLKILDFNADKYKALKE